MPPPDYSLIGSIERSNSREWPAVTVSGESVTIPYRIYNPVVREDAALSSEGRLALACLYSRHNDGRVRQGQVSRILAADDGAVAPFVLQLLGEYVIEITQDVLRFAQLELPTRPTLKAAFESFAQANPSFVRLTKERAVSYWAAYYRREYISFRDYPAAIALRLLVTSDGEG